VRVELTTARGETTTEYAVNLSAGGACLQVRRPLRVEELVHLVFTLPRDGAPVSVSGRVVWCTREEERGERGRFCEMGVRFEDADPALVEKLRGFARQPVNRRR
jgi:uncharacterized protein (TIGR02266 family)